VFVVREPGLAWYREDGLDARGAGVSSGGLQTATQP
jgi:hypothetical protein